jgi:coproporphyrinogen III oxidase
MSGLSDVQRAMELVSGLQALLVAGLEEVGDGVRFEQTTWLRDEGRHGGGNRFSSGGNDDFDRASVNVSQIHYDDMPEKKLGSATALSTIIHPRNPYAPSMHMHISWTEMKGGEGYWRMMADLNPSIENAEDTAAFRKCLERVASAQYEEAAAQGDRYFYIPTLERHRGVAHFYLEGYKTDDAQADRDLAGALGRAVIDVYLSIFRNAVGAHTEVSESARAEQLAYHTLYFFQVLTLDRGTTSGLLVHDQNDVGIMGSLPSQVDKALLASWRDRLPVPQEKLLDRLLGELPDGEPSHVGVDVKLAVARAVREHYREYPEALGLQASGNTTPPTVENHR